MKFWFSLRVFVVGFVVGLVAASCSGSGSDSADSGEVAVPGGTATTAAPVVTEAPETTLGVPDWAEGLPSPATTISTDPDIQEAVNTAFWSYEVFVACAADPASCEPQGKDSRGLEAELLDVWVELVESWQAEGAMSLPDPRPHESVFFSASKSADDPDVVKVVTCQRNYVVHVDPSGVVIDDASPLILVEMKVRKNSDGKWRLISRKTLDKQQPEEEGGDQCQQYKDFG